MALTGEQQKALDELFGAVEPSSRPESFWQTWFGLSDGDLQQVWHNLAAGKNHWQSQLVSLSEQNPMDAAFGFLGAASAAFYAVERGANPKINSYIDSFYYIATCASVGYADVFAVTQTGKAIASLVMVVGPALAARALDRPGQPNEN